MTRIRNWGAGSPPFSFFKNERVLPLLPTILAGVFSGFVVAGSALSAGYGLIAAMVCYVVVGVLVSLLLPLAFQNSVALRADSDREKFGQLWSEVGMSGELDELDQHFLSELEWLVHQGQGNTNLGLYQGSWVMLVAGETKEARYIHRLFTEAGFNVRDSRNLQDATRIILNAPECWDLLCIDFDTFDGLVDFDIVVEQLSSFREVACSVPVMLMSRSFSQQDGSSHLLHRPSIADGCLRVPAAESSVFRALKDTCINNLIWQYCRDRV